MAISALQRLASHPVSLGEMTESLDLEDIGLTPFRSGRRTSKLAIVGAGAVGSTMAYAALLRGAARSVALYDINAAKVEAEALDLGHGIQFMPMAEVVGSDDIAVCADADVVMFTAGAKQKPGQSRLDLAEATIGLVRKVLPALVEVAPDAVYVMVTNPVDVVTYAALQISGLPPSQLFGSGTVLDSSRLRYLISQHTGVAVQNVHAYIAGEHGDTELPLWGSASIGSVPLLEWTGTRRQRAADRRGAGRASRTRWSTPPTGSSRARARRTTRSPWPAPGSSRPSSRTSDACCPVSSLLDDFHGISDVCLSVPAIVGAHGVGRAAAGPAVGRGAGRAARAPPTPCGRWRASSASDATVGPHPASGGPDGAARRRAAVRGCAGRSPRGRGSWTRRPGSGEYAGLCGMSQTWPSMRLKVLTVASPSIIAATISPFSATG